MAAPAEEWTTVQGDVKRKVRLKKRDSLRAERRKEEELIARATSEYHQIAWELEVPGLSWCDWCGIYSTITAYHVPNKSGPCQDIPYDQKTIAANQTRINEISANYQHAQRLRRKWKELEAAKQ